MKPLFLGSLLLALLGFGFYLVQASHPTMPSAYAKPKAAKEHTKATLPKHLVGIKLDKVKWKKKKASYWKKVLTPGQYQVCRRAGTERPFTGSLLHNKKKGLYLCSSCGQALFSSEAKFRSGTGWPSFYQPYKKSAVSLHADRAYGMIRVEVKCSRCNAHLGHVFEDGPKPTGKRYCINSVCLLHQAK